MASTCSHNSRCWPTILGNLWRRLELPHRIKTWSLTSSRQRLRKTSGWLVKHAQYY